MRSPLMPLETNNALTASARLLLLRDDERVLPGCALVRRLLHWLSLHRLGLHGLCLHRLRFLLGGLRGNVARRRHRDGVALAGARLDRSAALILVAAAG